MPSFGRSAFDSSARRAERHRMVQGQIVGLGIADDFVIEAMRAVPREAFVDETLAEFAYVDSPLPIAEGQTISQPYIVALMAEAAELQPEDKVLEIGTGSGYAAAVYAEIAGRVFTIERHEGLARSAEAALKRSGFENVQVRCGDGTLGWPEEAPFDAILVAAGAPRPPESLKRQLAHRGRMIIPVNANGHQRLIRIRRSGEDAFDEEDLGPVRFVPLVGREGWARGNGDEISANSAEPLHRATADDLSEAELAGALKAAAEPLPAIDDPSFALTFDRLGNATIVGLGEATHGTSEFYRARAAITRRLIEEHGFGIVAVEADWPDAARIDRYVRGRPKAPWSEPAFTRFPTWMWRNEDVHEFVDWLRDHNSGLPPDRRVSFHGLDLYALGTSIAAVIAYLEDVDAEAAEIARQRYGCLTPWQKDPAAYGRAAVTGAFADCEQGVLRTLRSLLENRLSYAAADPDDYLDAEGNARLVAAAERYYRSIYWSDESSWNLRDRHMFETLERIRAARPAPAKAVIWAHNSHVGNARATEMGVVREELNIGQLCRDRFGERARLLGFGTNSGEVMAARNWDEPGEVRTIRPARAGSIEALCHQTGRERFLLDLERQRGTALADALLGPRLERAIGVIYRPETELASHYFEASLPAQFDHYVWFDRTSPVRPLRANMSAGPAETYPFGL